ncbi:MAG: oxidoreductase [Bacteroidales bacterium]|nr:oxidoreductase [Bacteroidales bacterium]
MNKTKILWLLGIMIIISCNSIKEKNSKFSGAKGEVSLMTLDPGHFHAALVQKETYEQVNPIAHVFAPQGPDVTDYLNRIENFNTREINPTHWDSQVYIGSDFLEKMITERPGNVMVTAGNNRKKTEYIKAAVDAGINVLADKPMAINKEDFALLIQAFESAEKNDVLLYDIMTERYEITSILQKELSQIPEVFGQLLKGSPEEPAISKESIHHFFKYVSGRRLQRPAWFFDVLQEGEGIVDVTTHLVDLIQWECFPEQIIDYKNDIEMISAKRWPTDLRPSQFYAVTGLIDYPGYLHKDIINDSILQVFSNGEIIYRINGVCAKVSVSWNFQAPEGAGDTHYSIMRGSTADLIIKQGAEQNYKPALYIEPVVAENLENFETLLVKQFQKLANIYPGIALKRNGNSWEVLIPDEYRTGHESHFAEVTEKYLSFLLDGKLPEWEVPNMIAKYYITTKALELARGNK